MHSFSESLSRGAAISLSYQDADHPEQDLCGDSISEKHFLLRQYMFFVKSISYNHLLTKNLY